MSALVKSIARAIRKWHSDHIFKEAAALAFYTILGLPALLLVISSTLGFFVDNTTVNQFIFELFTRYTNPTIGLEIQNLLISTPAISFNSLGAVFGLVLLFFTATSITHSLQSALNTIWKLGKPAFSWSNFFRQKARLLLVLPFTSLFFLTIIILQTLLPAIWSWLPVPPLPGFGLMFVRWILSVSLLVLVFTLIYKLVPHARIRNQDALVGGTITATLFTVGNLVISWYLTNRTLTLHSAASSILALLLWLYYSTIIFLIGAEITQAYATLQGHAIISTATNRWRRWVRNLFRV